MRANPGPKLIRGVHASVLQFTLVRRLLLLIRVVILSLLERARANPGKRWKLVARAIKEALLVGTMAESPLVEELLSLVPKIQQVL